MDRRDTLKTLLIGSVATGALLKSGCKTSEIEKSTSTTKLYGRTPEEAKVDKKLKEAPSEFTSEELATIAILCDIILPSTAFAGSATDAEVPAFIDFIVKDIPTHLLPLKGGLMWLNHQSLIRFNKSFKDLDSTQQINIIDDIAYPDNASAEMLPGVRFFNKMRDLTLTGYYTSKMGIEDLGYQGNRANAWDGVPEEVLKEHDVDYDAEWLAKCVDQSQRFEIAKWDENGRLLT
ncbi:MAG: gluconate 2-dehydrogenase subunit 3 family protein [Bacteroidia bacterium]|nr:gluconate 2-dehydrogenase subunit 3 family protein [Bacteroidia bacterium]